MKNQLYEMTILAENCEKFQKCLEEEYLDRITIKKEVPILPYMVCHLDTTNITRKELANLQERFLF